MKPDRPPSPTPEEEQQLKVMIEDWETLDSLSRAICTALVRGYDKPESVAAYIGASVDDIREAVRRIWGILLDRGTSKLWFR